MVWRGQPLLLVFLTAVVSFLTTFFRHWLRPSFWLLRGRLALRPCFLAARHGCRLLTLGGRLLEMLACLLFAFYFRLDRVALRPCFLAARRGRWLLTLNRCLLRVLHGRAFPLQRG